MVKYFVSSDEEDESSSESESEEESEDDDDESNDEAEEEYYDLENPPVGCDVNLFALACVLREKRADVEEDMNEAKKAKELLFKDVETWMKRIKNAEAAAEASESEFEAYQVRFCGTALLFCYLIHIYILLARRFGIRDWSPTSSAANIN